MRVRFFPKNSASNHVPTGCFRHSDEPDGTGIYIQHTVLKMTFHSSSTGSSDSFDPDTVSTGSKSSNNYGNNSQQYELECTANLDPATTTRLTNLFSSCTCTNRCYWKENHNQWTTWLQTVDKMDKKIPKKIPCS